MAKITDKQIKEARSKDLKEFLESEGFRFRRHGSSYACIEHNSLVLNRRDDGLWYNWYSRSEKGDIITFVKNNITNGNFREAVAYILNCDISSYDIKDNHNNESDKNIIKGNVEIELSSDMRRTFAYLTKSRGINKDIVNQLIKQNKIVQDSKNNIVFKYIDENGKIVGGELKGTLSNKSFSGIVQNSNEDYGFALSIGDKNNIKELKVFEASVDLLSFYQLFKDELKDTILLSMGGCAKIKKISTYLRQYDNISLITVCVDNDDAGNTAFCNIIKEYSDYRINDGRGYLIEHNLKDFNDLLRKGIII